MTDERITPILSVSQATARSCPRLDSDPLPCGPITDRVVGFGKDLAPLPLIDGAAAHVQTVGDVGKADDGRVRVGHVPNCRDYLLTSPDIVRDNLYMTNNDLHDSNDPPPTHMGDFHAEFEYLPERPVAQPSTNHTRGTTCIHCGEWVERHYTADQQRKQAHYRPQTYRQAQDLGVAEPTGAWVHLQTGDMRCG